VVGYGKWLLLTWLAGFILAELLGVSLAYLAYRSGVGVIAATCVADSATVTARLLVLILVARRTALSLASAVYKPLPGRSSALILAVFAAVTAGLDYVVTVLAYGGYEAQLLGYTYYLERKALWAFPLKVAYYLSEVVVMNYMYLLACRVWRWSRRPITAGTLFLVAGWALPHLLTKSLIVAAYAAALVLLFYTCYEYARTPIAPITLWLLVLTV
jgi:hypothetical protein